MGNLKEDLILCIGGALDGKFMKNTGEFLTTLSKTQSPEVTWTKSTQPIEFADMVCNHSLYKKVELCSNQAFYKIYLCQDKSLDVIEELIKGYRRAV